MAKVTLLPMVGYQGGKRRYAAVIANAILARRPSRVYDLGVGSGAITLALIDRGFDPAKITAVDAGPWGSVWEAVGSGSFSVLKLEALIRKALDRPATEVKRWIEEELASEPCTPEVFIVMQAASFGSSPVWHDGEKWRGDGERGYCARSHWTPGPSSRETKPRGTIFAANKIVSAERVITQRALRLDGKCAMAEEIEFEPGAVVYVDPPYMGTGGYGYAMNWRSIVERYRPVLVSEARGFNDATSTIELEPRKSGSLRGISRGRPSEYLNVWEPCGEA